MFNKLSSLSTNSNNPCKMLHEYERASLMGVPAEIRLKIYENFFDDHLHGDLRTVFQLYNNLYDYTTFSAPSRSNSHLGILRTCRAIHHEATDCLYSKVKIIVCVMGMKMPYHFPRRSPIGRPENIGFWRSVRRLELNIFLETGCHNKRVVLERIHRLAEQALENGRHLKKLRVVISSPEDEALPYWYEDVVDALKVLKVRGDVRVRFDVDDSPYYREDPELDEVCEALSRAIKKSECIFSSLKSHTDRQTEPLEDSLERHESGERAIRDSNWARISEIQSVETGAKVLLHTS